MTRASPRTVNYFDRKPKSSTHAGATQLQQQYSPGRKGTRESCGRRQNIAAAHIDCTERQLGSSDGTRNTTLLIQVSLKDQGLFCRVLPGVPFCFGCCFCCPPLWFCSVAGWATSTC